MLNELHVANLGVIEDARLCFGPGMTVLTGETGTGKTLVVDALSLLLGGKAEAEMVRDGEDEALIEGRFDQPSETVLIREITQSGRSRAFLNGRMATNAALADAATKLVDIYGQHSHQALRSRSGERTILDIFTGVDLKPLSDVRNKIRDTKKKIDELGGSIQTLDEEAASLEDELSKIDRAQVESLDELDKLEIEEEVLQRSTEYKETASFCLQMLSGETSTYPSRSIADLLNEVLRALHGKTQLAQFESRIESVMEELADIGLELRSFAENIEDDPGRLAFVAERRRMLIELSRRYGGDLQSIMEYAQGARQRLEEIQATREMMNLLGRELEALEQEKEQIEKEIAARRQEGAYSFANKVEEHLKGLAMPKAHFVVEVGGNGPMDDISFLFTANPGTPPKQLSKVASGGELSRTMLAICLVVSSGPPTLIFDEVDAGVGGEAGISVGRALSRLARDHQVIVVTHLPQVAAFADHHISVRKEERSGKSISVVTTLAEEERVIELSRMLAGRASSKTGQQHAKELLELAALERSRW